MRSIDIWEYDWTVEHSLLNRVVRPIIVIDRTNWTRDSLSSQENRAGLMLGFYQNAMYSKQKKTECTPEKSRSPCLRGRFRRDGQINIEFQPVFLSLSEKRLSRLVGMAEAFSKESLQLFDMIKSQSCAQHDPVDREYQGIQGRDIGAQKDAKITSNLSFIRVVWAEFSQSGLETAFQIDVSESKIVSPLPCALADTTPNGQVDERRLAMMGGESGEQLILDCQAQGMILEFLSDKSFKSAFEVFKPMGLRVSTGYINSNFEDTKNRCARFAKKSDSENSGILMAGEGIVRDHQILGKLFADLTAGSYHPRKRMTYNVEVNFPKVNIGLEPAYISTLSDAIHNSLKCFTKTTTPIDKSVRQQPSQQRDFLLTVKIAELEAKISDEAMGKESASFFKLSLKPVTYKFLSWGGEDSGSFLALGQHGEGDVYQDDVLRLTWSESALTRGDGQGDGKTGSGLIHDKSLESGISFLLLSSKLCGSNMLSIRTDGATLESGKAAHCSWLYSLTQLLDTKYWRRICPKSSKTRASPREVGSDRLGAGQASEDDWEVAVHVRDIAVCYDYRCLREKCAGAAMLVKEIQGIVSA